MQWGDDWDDFYWQDNCGTPYEPLKSSLTKWKIIKVAFDMVDLEVPENSKYTVEYINCKKVPWLSNRGWVKDPYKVVEIWAGASPAEFDRVIRSCGGKLYYAM